MTPESGRSGSATTVLALLTALVAGACLLLWLTPHGIGLYYDSMTYMESAETLAAGHGLGQVRGDAFLPLIHYPPMYSLLLAGMSALRVDLPEGARVLGAAALGLVSALVGATVGRATRSWLLAAVGAVWVLLSTPVWTVFTWAMSEPVFLPLWLASILVLDAYMLKPDRRLLITAALLSGAAFLTRYVGGIPILAAASVLVLGACRKKAAWSDVVLYLALACAPSAAWLVRNQLIGGSTTNRFLALHLPSREVVRQGADTVLGWFGPSESFRSEEAVALAGLALALLFALLLATSARKRTESGTQSYLLGLHILTAGLYLGAILVSITLFDSQTPLDNRILIPAYLSMGIVLLATFHQAWERRSATAVVSAGVVIAALMVRQLARLEGAATTLRADGQGYASARWRNSEIGHRLREMAPPMIYTNDTTAVYFIAGLPSTSIPTPGGSAGLESMREDLATDGAVLAIFGNITQEFMPVDVLTSGLTVAEDLADGRIYVHPH